MSTRRLVAGKVYTPVGGVNFDSNSLTIGENECSGIQNLRVFPNEVKTRCGSRRIAANVPGGEKILHFHTYKKPNGNEQLFAFTATGIYRLNSADGSWKLMSKIILEDGASDTDWSLLGDGSPVGTLTATSEGLEFSAGDVEDGSLELIKENFNQDLTGKSYLSFTLSLARLTRDYGSDVEDPDGNFVPFGADGVLTFLYERDITVTLFDGVSEVFSGTITAQEWHRYTQAASGPTVVMPDAYVNLLTLPLTGGVTTCDKIVITISPRPGDQVLLEGTLGDISTHDTTFNVTFWSTCDFIDADLGATVIAAGSNPAEPTEPEDDGAARVLLYYDTADEVFKPLALRTVLQTEVATSSDGGGTGTSFSGTITLPSGSALTPFGFNLLASGLRLYDDGDGHLSGDGIGTVNYTSGAWTATFSSGVGAVVANYLYYSSLTLKPRHVANYGTRLMMGNVYDGTDYFPWRIHWTDVADRQTSRSTYYQDLIETSISPIEGFAYAGEYLVIYMRQSVAKCRATGASPAFSFYTVWQYGTFAGKTIVEWNNANFLLGHDDVYLFDGNSFRAIATKRVRDHLFQRMDRGKYLTFFANFDELNKEYWLWVTPAGADYPTDVYVYSVLYNTWSFFKFAETTCAGRYYTNQGRTIDELVGTIDQQNWRLNSGLLGGALRSMILAASAGDVYAQDERLVEDRIVDSVGTAIAWNLITLDFLFMDLARKDRLQRVHFEASGKEVTVGYATSYKQDPTSFENKVTVEMGVENTEHQYWPDIVHEQVRLLFEGEGAFALRWVQPFVITEEKD